MKRWMKSVNISIFHCPDCGCKIPLPRPDGVGNREKGHIKDIWCPVCKEEKHFKEQRQCDHQFTD